MGLLDRMKVDLEKVDAKATEESVKSNGLPAIGLHHAILEGCREIDPTAKTNGGYELRFKIIGGPAKGLEVKEALWVPLEDDETGIDEKEVAKRKRLKSRVLMFMSHLGMLNKIHKNGQDHFVPVAGKSELTHCLGVECVIDVGGHADRKGNDGKTYTDAKLSFGGVLKMDDKRCEKVARGKAGEAVTVAGAGGGGGSGGQAASVPSQQKFDDI